MSSDRPSSEPLDIPALALLTVLNAPHLRAAERAGAVGLAREQNVQAVALVPPLADPDAPAGSQARQDVADLHRELGGPDSPGLCAEGFRTVYRLLNGLEGGQFRRVPLPPDHRELPGPFDLIGDIHDCLPELLSLLSGLGYAVNEELEVVRPAGRTLVFLGDLTDRGPDSPGVLRLVMSTVAPRYAWGQPRRQAAARLARSRGQGRARFRALVIQTPYVFMTECSVPDTFDFCCPGERKCPLMPKESISRRDGRPFLLACLRRTPCLPRTLSLVVSSAVQRGRPSSIPEYAVQEGT